jgi:hypothetical protein
MSDKETIHAELKRIRTKVDALLTDFNKVNDLSSEEFKTSSLKVGAVINAAKNAEVILKYVCKSSGVTVKAKPNAKGEASKSDPALDDYIHYASVNKLIKSKIFSEFQNIRNIRNGCAHVDEYDVLSDEHEELSATKVESVKESITYITDWFFKTYLKNEYPELSIKKSKNSEIETPYIKKEIRREDSREATIASIPISETPKRNKHNNSSKARAYKILAILLLLSGIIYAVYYWQNTNPTTVANSEDNEAVPASINTNSVSTLQPGNSKVDVKSQVFDLISHYYSTLIDSSDFNGSICFAENISEFKNLEDQNILADLSPVDISSKHKKNTNLLNPSFVLSISNLEQMDGEGDETKWVYTDKLSEFKSDEISNSKRKIKIEFSVNSQNKITSLKETEEEQLGGS